MQTIDDPGAALAVLHDPAFVVPPVPAATHGIAWLRSAVGRFSGGDAYTRRRALSESLLSTVDLAALRDAAASSPYLHPVQLLCTALGLPSSSRTTLAAVRTVAAAYHPGTGDEPAADEAVRELVDLCGGTPDEATAARIGLLVQACDATATLIARARATSLEAALRDDPPVPATKRIATRPVTLPPGHPEPAGLPGVRSEPDNRTDARSELDNRTDAHVEPGNRTGVRVELDDRPRTRVEPDDLLEVRVEPAGRSGTRVEPGDRFEVRVEPDGPPESRVEAGGRGGVHVEAGEVVRISLRGIPFGAGPRRCPGRAHALAIAEGAVSASVSGNPGGGR
ncbi:hypothetical protein [Dactylosporangium sp. NPDC000521]|uniref:hypothetical protein n=1 Tax=Dactylosporangium sp. NPDC000521 TaxID=3363975 RepID=UPI0036BB03B9